MTTPHIAICALCWSSFEAHTSYGLCPDCWSKDRLREFDRLEAATTKAHRHKLPALLTLREWLSVTSDFKGRCAYCLEVAYSFIETVHPEQGLTFDNAVPICRACSIHKADSFEAAQRRVEAYLVHNIYEVMPDEVAG
jgi:hypothetical protein